MGAPSISAKNAEMDGIAPYDYDNFNDLQCVPQGHGVTQPIGQKPGSSCKTLAKVLIVS